MTPRITKQHPADNSPQHSSKPSSQANNPVLDETDALCLSEILNRVIASLAPIDLSDDEALCLFHIVDRARHALWDRYGQKLLPYFDGSFFDEDSAPASVPENPSELDDELSLIF